jgi:hypothetical protein
MASLAPQKWALNAQFPRNVYRPIDDLPVGQQRQKKRGHYINIETVVTQILLDIIGQPFTIYRLLDGLMACRRVANKQARQHENA